MSSETGKTNGPTITPSDVEALTAEQLEEAGKTATSEYNAITKVDDKLAKLILELQKLYKQYNADSIEALIQTIEERDDFDEDYALASSLKSALKQKHVARLVHDSRNLLAGALGSVDVMLTRPLPSDLKSLAEDARNCLVKAVHLYESMLSNTVLSDRPEKEACNIKNLIQPTVDRVKEIHEGITVEAWIDEDCRALVDPAQISRVIDNLVKNAVESMPNGGRLKIEVITDRHTGPVPAKTSAYVIITISDTGCGISDEHRKQIYNPHFSTKGKDGTGLGLSNVKKIIEAHGGHIMVKSPAGGGFSTEFKIVLPSD